MLLLLFAAVRAAAQAASSAPARGFPPAGELFERLLADPRQTQTSARYYRAFGMDMADVALGDRWGLKRWAAGRDASLRVQADIEGMAYSVFKLSGSVNEFETVDFFANLPVEARRGRFSARAMLFHESSHLGDDYVRRTEGGGRRYSVEGARFAASWDAAAWARLYAGASYLLHRIPAVGRRAVQGGFELSSPPVWRSRPLWRLYLAQDFQSKEFSAWNVDSSTELGLRLAYEGQRQAVRLHVGHFEGHAPFGQFPWLRLSTNSVGASFDF